MAVKSVCGGRGEKKRGKEREREREREREKERESKGIPITEKKPKNINYRGF